MIYGTLHRLAMEKKPSELSTIAIIGGGAAGMSCALWLCELGYQPVIIERSHRLGGQLLALNRRNRWVLGFPEQTSVELAKRYAEHIANIAVTVSYESQPVAVATLPYGYDLTVTTAHQNLSHWPVRALVIATGVRPVGAEAFGNTPGFAAAVNAGLVSFFPFDHLDLPAKLDGRKVAVIGGGDNAHYTAKDLSLAGATVYLIMRSSPKARPAIRAEVEQLIRQQRIREYAGATISAFQQHPCGIELTLTAQGQTIEKLSVERLYARLGFVANSDFLDAFEVFAGVAKQNGYLVTDDARRTNLPGLYAIGDIAHRRHQSVVAAIADGAVAAQDLSERIA